MPCEIASFGKNDKYDMTLFFIKFYIYLIIIVIILIFINTTYNYYIYNNIISDRLYKDVKIVENGEYPPKGNEVSSDNNILIGETVDYKLFISLLLDQNMYYNDKYFTLNITNILLDVFMMITIVLVFFFTIYIGLSRLPKTFTKQFIVKLDFGDLGLYIKQYCYFVNNEKCDGYGISKIFFIGIIFILLIIIYFLRYTYIPSIKYGSDYLDFKKSFISTDNIKNLKNIENMLNIISDVSNAKEDFLDNNDNINRIINKLNGHNIHTVSTVSTIDTSLKNSDELKINTFIYKIKEISVYIKNISKSDNKDLDFVKLVIVYLNNKKIYNDNNNVPGKINSDLAKTYAQSLLNIITNVIPLSEYSFRKFKTGNYDIENLLIGAVPLHQRDNINYDPAKCSGDYRNTNDIKAISEIGGCFYNNHVFNLKEDKTKLRNALIIIFVLSMLAIFAILILFYTIYIFYNSDNKDWARDTAIRLTRNGFWRYPLYWIIGSTMQILNLAN